MSDDATLRIRLEQTEALRQLRDLQEQLRRARREVDDMERQTRRAAGGMSSAFGSVKNAIAGLAAAAGAGAAGSFLFNTIKEFETLRTTLNTTAGGVEQGAAAFALLQDVAKETPNSLQQMVQSFNILAARGIKPSRDQLIAFANTASATGKSINQFAEAIADAQTGEFERLKEFGIVVRKEGDQLAVQTGKGVTTIKNNSQSIVDELTRIGQVNFGGAATSQMATLGGQLSNLGYQFSQIAFNIGEGGLKQAISEVIAGFAGTTDVSVATARAVGEVLGNAVRGTAAIISGFVSVVQTLSPALAGIAAGGAVVAITNIGRSIVTATTATRAWTVALLANPVGIVAAAVGTLVAALGFFIQSTLESEGISASWFDILRAGANIISRTLSPAIAGVRKFIASLGPVLVNIGQGFRGLVNFAIATQKSVVDVFFGMGKAIFDAFKGVVNSVGQVFKAIAQAATGDFKAAGSTLIGAFSQGFNIRKNISNTVGQVRSNFSTDWVGVGISWAKSTVSGFTDEVRSVTEATAAANAKAKKEADALAGAYQPGIAASENAARASDKAREAKSRETDAVKTFVERLQDQKADLEIQIATYGQTEAQVLALKLAREAETLGIDANSKAIQDNVRLQQQLQELRLKEYLATTVSDIEFETRALELNTKERAIAVRIRDAERQAKAAGRALTEQEIADIRRATAAYEDRNQAIEDGKRAAEEAKQKAEEMERKRQEMAKETTRIYNDGFRAFGDGLNQMINQSEVNLKSLLLLAIRTAAQIAAANYALSLNNGGGRTLGGALVTGLAGALGGGFGGFRERGGPVSAGRAYVVGERRPELFVPRTDGYIMPSVPTGRSMSGGVSVTANFYGSISASNLDEVREQITRSLRDSINSSRIAMVDEQRPGGIFYGRN